MTEIRTRVVVVGSINMDLVTRVERLPRAGETVSGRELLQIPGGKGANQAVAAAQLGAESTMIGRVGDDGFGSSLKRALSTSGVLVDQVTEVAECSSGVALIGVEDCGQNAITIVSGANGRLTPDDIQQVESVIAAADVVLVQLEIPLETVAAAIRIAQGCGVRTVLDPAPVPGSQLPEPLWQVQVLSPNQTEAEELTGVTVRDPQTAHTAAEVLLRRGAGAVVIKLGDQGAFWNDGSTSGHVATWEVDVVDTTAAGDAFTAALAVGLAEGRDLAEAVRFGCAAGTLATTQLGAQRSMPTRAAVDRFPS